MMLLLLNLGALAQEYDSTYTAADGTIGTAKFDYYYDIDHLMVKNGAFEFESSKTDSSWDSTFEEVSVSGNYTENKKSKDWRYKITRREIAIRGISADSIDYDLRTYETSINGHYTNGIPTDSWTMLTTLKHKGHPLQTYDSTQISFKKGYADGPFHHVGTDANGEPVLVQGQFEKGVFTGEWRFEYMRDGQIMNESRQYALGILKSVSITTLSVEPPITASTPMPLSVKASEALRKTDRSDLISPPTSLEFNDGYPQSSIYVSIQKSGNDILNQLQKSLLRFDPDILDKQQVIYGAVRVFHPFSEDEKLLVTQWNDVEDAFRDKVALVKEHEIRDFGNSQDSIAVVALKWIER